MSVQTTAQATFSATLVDEWVRSGITDAVGCPGSRSTPLIQALYDRSEIRLHMRLDERSAGFFAIGLSRCTGRPTVICTTSGTAAAELHPAVVEGHYGGVPLIVCTADRPRRLHGVGAPQTIDQIRIFGTAVSWSFEVGSIDSADSGWWRSLAARCALEATQGPRGPSPVHLNLSFDDPLVGVSGPLPPGRRDNLPWHQVISSTWAVDESFTDRVSQWTSKRGVIVTGARGGSSSGVLALAELLGWPVLADPRSRCRTAHHLVVGAADSILRDPLARDRLVPEVVVMLGEMWASRVVADFLVQSHRSGAQVIAVDPHWRWADPDRIVSEIYRVDPDEWLQAATDAMPATNASLSEDSLDQWSKRWSAAEAAAQTVIDEVLAKDAAERNTLSEPGVARHLFAALPPRTTVMVSSSMPIRDLEWFSPAMADPPKVLANRGANGIDGVCSTAQGVAAAGEGPVVALVGDLAFLHDTSSLSGGPELSVGDSCVLVVLENGGGGIFNFLPQATSSEPGGFEKLFATPQRASLGAVAKGFGLVVAEVSTYEELAVAIKELTVPHPGPLLSVIRLELPNRDENVKIHTALNDAVGQSVRVALEL